MNIVLFLIVCFCIALISAKTMQPNAGLIILLALVLFLMWAAIATAIGLI